MKRRSFLSLSALTAVGAIIPRVFAKTFSFSGLVGSDANRAIGKPTVISTWKHGMAANNSAWEVLAAKGSGLDAVEAGLRLIESDPTNQSVGLGGLPDRDGNVTLDACIMNHEHECGAVAYLKEIENPISVARKVMENTPHVMLVGDGAQKFALESGFTKTNLLTETSKKDWLEWKATQEQKSPEINHENHDTIGMLAMDFDGNLSGACTTSGWGYKLPGRVGDSPIIGAGLFLDNDVGAACATGMGEAVIRIAGSHTVVELMRQGHSPNEACKMAVQRIQEKHKDLTNLQVGFIALNKEGEVGGYSVYGGFDYALRNNAANRMIDAGYDLER